MPDCIFCKDLPKVLENELAYVVYDIKPFTEGHMLIIPKRHYVTIFESSLEEMGAIFHLMQQGKALLIEKYNPDGFNILANTAQVAGQIVMHAHWHLIPRYKGQQINPHLFIH